MPEASSIEGRATGDRSLEVVGLFVYRAHHRYGETVTQLQHSLQAAQLARRDGSDDEMVLAALLHDLGHLLEEAADTPDRHHGHHAAEVLRPLVPPRVAWLVEQHVMAKRYLCAVDPGYAARLSPVSARSLAAQGARLSPVARRSFEIHPWFTDALRIRTWDDTAKDPAAVVAPLITYRVLIERWLGPQRWVIAPGIV